MKSTLIAAAIGIALTGSGYGGVWLADSRYVQNDAYRAGEVRKLQYQIDELKWTEEQRKLTQKESWQLKALQRQVEEAKKK